jgi:uracil-DNA glycosylase
MGASFTIQQEKRKRASGDRRGLAHFAKCAEWFDTDHAFTPLHRLTVAGRRRPAGDLSLREGICPGGEQLEVKDQLVTKNALNASLSSEKISGAFREGTFYTRAMSSGFQQLLAATIQHLEELKERGVRFVSGNRELLGMLKSPRARVSPQGHAPSTQRPFTRRAPKLESSSPPPATIQRPVPGRTAPVAQIENDPKAVALNELRQRALVCQNCPPLVEARKNVVFGVGDCHAQLMFVGEAPGADEDAQGEPFVGVAGQLLTRIIEAMGLSRQTVYIANVLKCRPDTPGQPYGNRKPTSEEMKTCLPYLKAQIEIIEPKVIVALGATAVEGLLGLAEPISRLRGRFQTFVDVPVMPTYHPSYVARNQTQAVKRQVWEDMLKVMERLNMPITEKQRKYFLPQG